MQHKVTLLFIGYTFPHLTWTKGVQHPKSLGAASLTKHRQNVHEVANAHTFVKISICGTVNKTSKLREHGEQIVYTSNSVSVEIRKTLWH